MKRTNVITNFTCTGHFHNSRQKFIFVLEKCMLYAGLIPAGSGNILSWRLIMKDFLWSFSLLLIQEGQLSV